MRDPFETARALVAERYPGAVAAWLSGSVTTGRATPTSDLDVTVVLHDVVVHRESLRYDGWPVELFVHTPASVRAFVVKDVARRRPTMARLVASGVPLVESGVGRDLAAECRRVLEAGPGPLDDEALAAARYALTDQLDDLAGGGPGAEQGAVAVAVWQSTAELVLAAAGRWSGGGKWLVREVEEHDPRWVVDLHAGLTAALAGDVIPLTAAADRALALVGGRLWEGHHAQARLTP